MSKPLPITRFIAVLLSFSIFLSQTGCKKSSSTPVTVPTVSTTNVILDVTTTTAQSGGSITAIGTDAVTDNGVCYSTTNTTPTLSDTKLSVKVSLTAYSFVCNLTGLTPSTTYYIRAYATSAAGTGYGNVIKFTTSGNLASIIGTVTTFAGNGTPGYMDANGTSAEFYNPLGMATDAAGNIYVADAFNNRIRKITPDGTVSTFAGNGTAGYTDGNALTEAEFYYPQGLAFDATGNLYVADYGNNVIRKITPAGVVSTFAGNGTAGYVNGAALTAAEFSGPSGIAFDKSGNLIIADRNNNIIRKVNTSASVSSVAGTQLAGFLDATVNPTNGVYGAFSQPNGIAIDLTSGNIYVADLGNNAIRQITPGNVISTVAGGPQQESVIGFPAAITIDAQSNLFIADESGRVIELTANKVLYPLAGTANTNGYVDDSGLLAQFSTPQGITVDKSGNVFVSDFNNNRIRKVVITTVGK